MDAVYPEEFLARALVAETRGDLDTALWAMVDGFARLLAEDSPVRQIPVGWPEADALCARLGAGVAEFEQGPWEDRDVFVATQVYAGGGHTAVIGDLVRHSASADKMVLLTQTVERGIHEGGRPKSEIIARMCIGDEQLRVCPAIGMGDTLRWLLAELNSLRPRRVFMFHHPQDAPAVAAVQPGVAAAWYLVHHCDRTPCAGVYSPGVRLVDLSPFTAGFSQRVLGLQPAYLPMTVEDTCGPGRPPFYSGTGGRLTTVASGAEHKFGPIYPEIVTAVLLLTGGIHHHIGKLKKKQLQCLATALEEAEIPVHRFRYSPWVPSLAQALHDVRADVCLGSFPLGGARTAIEACAAGTPMLAHHPDWATLFGVTHLLPDGFPVWKTKNELLGLLRAIDRPWLEEKGRSARTFYEERHHPLILARALRAIDGGGAGVAPTSLTNSQVAEFVDLGALESQLHGPWSFLRREILSCASGRSS